MVNFFMGLALIFCGGFLGYLEKLMLPSFITGTDTASQLSLTGWPIATFVVLLVAGFFMMIGKIRKKQ